MEAPAKQQNFDIDTWLIQNQTVTTVTGETVTLKKPSWRKELQVMSQIKSILQAIAASGIFSASDMTDQEATTKVMALMFEHTPQAVESMIATLLDKDSEWVADNLDMEGMLNLAVPFLLSKRRAIEKLLAPYAAQANQA